jgi:hypothetical protein
LRQAPGAEGDSRGDDLRVPGDEPVVEGARHEVAQHLSTPTIHRGISQAGSWLRPCRAVPCRAVPCRAVPCRAVPVVDGVG